MPARPLSASFGLSDSLHPQRGGRNGQNVGRSAMPPFMPQTALCRACTRKRNLSNPPPPGTHSANQHSCALWANMHPVYVDFRGEEYSAEPSRHLYGSHWGRHCNRVGAQPRAVQGAEPAKGRENPYYNLCNLGKNSGSGVDPGSQYLGDVGRCPIIIGKSAG